MDNRYSDEQFDKMMRSLVAESSLADPTVDEIANSPALWWSVKREIEQQKETRSLPWPPIGKVARWLLIGAPAAAAIALLVFIFVPRSTTVDSKVAATATLSVSAKVTPKAESPSSFTAISGNTASKAVTERRPRPAPVVTRESAVTAVAKAGPKTAVRSDFIALSYARNPESGQIVRVKVPSAMMVSLGLVQSVSKPSDLVDAEVLIGDDGLTRAIRFIRQ